MKRIVCCLLTVVLAAGLFALTGCKNEKQSDLSNGMHLVYDTKITTLDGNTLENKDGHWRVVIHPCTSKKDLESRRRYFNNTLTSVANTNVLNEIKTFGALTFQTEYHNAGDQFAGSYFTVLDTPVKTNDILHPLYGIYCYVSAENNSYIDEIEAVMQGLSVKDLV